jgi:SAM-dependent methyltransferase
MELNAINISKDAYSYLVTQRGALDDMKADPRIWCEKYTEVLFSEFRSIEPFLPKVCRRVLDVGSGLGGINILLNEHYGGDLSVTLLDGVDDSPDCEKHASTFNDMGVARQFLALNGVSKMTYIDANDAHRFATGTYDLIVSFKSWCFHTPPELHLPLVLQACRPGTRIIVDMRGGQRAMRGEGSNADADAEKAYEYMRTMTKYFRHRGRIFYGIKFETHYFDFEAP